MKIKYDTNPSLVVERLDPDTRKTGPDLPWTGSAMDRICNGPDLQWTGSAMPQNILQLQYDPNKTKPKLPCKCTDICSCVLITLVNGH